MENITNLIILIASVISAFSVIIGAFITIYKFVRKVEVKIDSFDDNLKENTLSTLRLVIINEDMPLDERLNAGEKYVKLGGNGAIHALYEALQEKYKKKVK